jgi:hypothetical protein
MFAARIFGKNRPVRMMRTAGQLCVAYDFLFNIKSL